jgi:hypothetical protein
MDPQTETQKLAPEKQPQTFRLSEDWLSIILAFLIIILSALGILGKNGIQITF